VACRRRRGLAYLGGKLQGLFTRVRGNLGFAAASTGEGVLEESERQILELQRESGFDRYWRTYFWLSGW
jgi:hypothetical protein